jgi:hypothetical protein
MKNGSVNFITLLLAAVIIAGGYYFLIYQPRHQVSPLVGADRDAHGCIGSAGYSWCDVKQKCLRTWEEPCENTTPAATIDETEVLKAAMKAAIVAKRGAGAADMTYTISKVNGDYAQGGANGSGGGGMWFAAKVNGTWKLVWDGNGIITCADIAPYPDFPKTMIPECFNDATNKMVVR